MKASVRIRSVTSLLTQTAVENVAPFFQISPRAYSFQRTGKNNNTAASVMNIPWTSLQFPMRRCCCIAAPPPGTCLAAGLIRASGNVSIPASISCSLTVITLGDHPDVGKSFVSSLVFSGSTRIGLPVGNVIWIHRKETIVFKR